jgi:hypothetical protein
MGSVEADDTAVKAGMAYQVEGNTAGTGGNIEDERGFKLCQLPYQRPGDRKFLVQRVELFDAVIFMGGDVIEPDNDATAEIDAFGCDEEPIENGRQQKEDQQDWDEYHNESEKLPA